MSKGDQLKGYAWYIASVLKPDLPNLWSSKAGDAGKPTANKITYLDGLRGVSAAVVYLTHHAFYAHENFALHRAFGWKGQYYFAAFPGIRTFFSGGALATGLFFIISGYVGSISALNLLHKGDVEKLAKTLGTGLPRKFFRLYWPVIWLTLGIATSWHVFGVVSSNNATSLPKENYLLELRSWMQDCARLTYIFDDSGQGFDPYNPHLWYIPLQFRALVIINVILGCSLAFQQWGPSPRLWGIAAFIFYLLVCPTAFRVANCIVGLLICDLDLLAEKDRLPSYLNRLKPLALGGWVWHILFILGIWFAGVPRSIHDMDIVAENDPGWWYINYLTPAADNFTWYWVFWASLFLFVSVPRIPFLRSLFETRLALYLGDLSFGIYLVHGPLLWTIGARVYAAFGIVNSRAAEDIGNWWINLVPIPPWGPLGLELNYLAAQAVLIPITLWVGGIVHKTLDVPSGKIAAKLFDPKRYSMSSSG